MHEQNPQEEAAEAAFGANVVALTWRHVIKREPPVTDAEIREYRQMIPRLRAMLADWDRLTAAQTGCPVARKVLDRDT
jgi:hypothetical protein